MADFNEAFWVTTATAAPVLLVAYATTFVELFTRHRETARYRRRYDRLWASLWISAVPILGGLLTLGSVIVLAAHQDNLAERVVAILLLAGLLLGEIFSGVTLISLQRRFPPRRRRSWQIEI